LSNFALTFPEPLILCFCLHQYNTYKTQFSNQNQLTLLCHISLSLSTYFLIQFSTQPRPLANQAHSALSEHCVPHRLQLTA